MNPHQSSPPSSDAATHRGRTVSAAADIAQPVTHYENFPVASLLCPPHMRPAIAALYAFARTADDIADEGHAAPQERLADLAAYRADLQAIAQDVPPSARWAHVFVPLERVLRSNRLPVPLLGDLLSAFEQDVQKTRYAKTYANRAELLDYCRRSANPVGRLILHLYGIGDAQAQQESDAICTALQLANFWQDLSVDIPRGRHYLPDADCEAHGVSRADLATLRLTPQTMALIADGTKWARSCIHKGFPLVHRMPGRAGWELRLVVQGGIRILDKIDRLRGGSLTTRPRLNIWDWCVMLARAIAM